MRAEKLSVLCSGFAACAVMLLASAPLQAADGDGPEARRRPYVRLVYVMSARHGIDPRLVDAIIRTESSYRPHAVSRAGAVGLMQLMPATARRYGVRNRYDPIQNVYGGTAYLADLLRQFDLVRAIAAYNAGEGNVLRYGGVPPFAETRAFVGRVLLRYLGTGR